MKNIQKKPSVRLDVSLLKPIPAFSEMTREQLEEVISRAQTHRYEKDETVFDEGETATRFYMLLDGFVRVTHITLGGEQVIMLYIPPSELFGIAKATGRKTYPARAVAASEAIALSWSMELWEHFARDFPGFREAASQTLGKRMSQMTERMVEISTLGVEQRIAAALLRLANTVGHKDDGEARIDVALTRQDLSEITASTLYTVSRLISAWEKQGILVSKKKKFKIHDIEALEALSAPS